METRTRKTHRTSAVAIPPEGLWEPIQAIRRQHDRQIHRWMPHINLLYPFAPREQFAAMLPLLVDCCARMQPFEVTLAQFRHFTHARGRSTIWLAPEPQAAFVTLQDMLQGGFPDYHEQSRFAGGFTPHLSVGQAASAAHRHQLLAEFQHDWSPLTFHLSAIALIWRDATGPFRVHTWLPLGTPGVDV